MEKIIQLQIVFKATSIAAAIACFYSMNNNEVAKEMFCGGGKGFMQKPHNFREIAKRMKIFLHH